MRMVDLISKKRHNIELTTAEIEWIINGYTNKEIPDYQMSALLMAIVFNDMTKAERLALTQAMVNSGDVVDLSAIEGVKVDKHSTGGVGDKTSLILGPLVASMGVPVAKMSGRGLGHTGGTLDKLESISGMKIEIEMDQFIQQVNDIKLAIIGQTGNLAPADKYLYALRDVTGTVESIPLIASSIMSKKIAAGADAIVLDVKFGAGAFMKTLDDAKELATAMVEIGRDAGRETVAFLTDMNQPLGFAIGNALEVKEAIETLSGNGPKDLEELVLQLASHMVVLAKKAANTEQAYAQLKEKLQNGEALQKFKEFVAAQGGDTSQIENPELLPTASSVIPVTATETGYVEKIDALSIGIAAMKLGAGRATKEDTIDMGVGVVLNKKVGEAINQGDVLAYVHTNQADSQEAIEYIKKAYEISSSPVCSPTLIYDIIA
ncbi:pyrimidine-nucleoside phosphorylase [Turicibacter bilis]|uniref:pyrimidine-nucleoside phosphorylase n=1 Tax=Turicibacter bilis TaxID=2735723 RepID=UPI0031BB2656